MVKSKIEKLRDKLVLIEQEICLELSLLPKAGEECHCTRELGTIKIVHQGSEFDEIIEYCLSCGGIVV